MKIDNILLDKLTAEAQASPRLRMNLDLRNSDADSSQRMLNAIEPGSGVLEASYELAAGGDARSESGMTEVACALNIPAGQWHTLRALESGTVILEMKDGAYEPIGPAEILSM